MSSQLPSYFSHSFGFSCLINEFEAIFQCPQYGTHAKNEELTLFPNRSGAKDRHYFLLMKAPSAGMLWCTLAFDIYISRPLVSCTPGNLPEVEVSDCDDGERPT